MRVTNFNKNFSCCAAIICCLINAISCTKQQQNPTIQPGLSQTFFAAPSDATFYHLAAAGIESNAHTDPLIASHIEEYNRARLQRDLPNSMTREGHLDEFFIQQDQVMKDQFEKIKFMPEADVWRIIEALCKAQWNEKDEDYEALIWTSAEIGYRLSPGHLREVAAVAYPASRDIVLRVQERFKAGQGHIDDLTGW